MELSTVEIPRTEARREAADYSRAAKRARDPLIRKELEQMARAYRIAARDEVPLIALSPTIARGGTMIRTLTHNRGTANERKSNYLLPHLAVAPAEARFCFTLGVEADGRVRFVDSLHRRSGNAPRGYKRGRVDLRAGLFELPEGFTTGTEVNEYQGTWGAWSCMVPIVPPKHRPARGLGDTLVLWEVENWTWRNEPRPPGDPALLRHVAGDVYAVLATWDLTELEKLVLSGRALDTA